MRRTRVYNSIVKLLSDRQWHRISEMGQVTPFPDLWAKTLSREREFELDPADGKIRLRPSNGASRS